MYIGNTPFQGLVGGGNILDASIEGVDLSTSAIAARLGYTPVDPGAAAFTATLTAKDIQQDNATYIKGKLAAGTTTRLFGINASDTIYIGSIDANHTGGTLFVKNGATQMNLDATSNLTVVGDLINNGGRLSLYRSAGTSYIDWASGQSLVFRTETSAGGAGAATLATLDANGLNVSQSSGTGVITVGSNAGRAQYQYLTFGGGVGGTDYGWQIGRSASNGIAPDGFYIYDIKSNTNRVAIDLNGNFGIATNSPGTKLDIGSAQGSGITLRYDATTAYRALITPYWNSGTDTRIDFAINSVANTTPTVYLSVGYSGNVGIGTTTPSQKFHVANAGAVVGLVQNTSSTADARLRTQNTQAYLEFGQDSTGGYIQQSGAYPIIFYQNAGERARFDASGNFLVGGTLNNSYKAIVSTNSGGSVTNTFAIHNGNNYGGTGTGSRLLFKLSNFEDAIEQNKFASIEGIGVSAYNEDTSLIFRTQSNANRGNLPTEKMRLDYAGWLTFPNSSGFRNYGIKASGFGYSPASYGALIVGSPVGGNNTTVCINVDPVGNTNGSFSGLGGEVMFRNGVSFITPTADNSNFYLNILNLSNGNVGVGMTPTYKLDISGRVRVTGSQSSPSTTDILPSSIAMFTGGGGDYLTIGQYTNSHFWIQGGYLNPSLAKYDICLQPLGGKVGVGTSSPVHTLDVNGTVGVKELYGRTLYSTSGANIDLTEYTANNFVILEVFGFMNPNSGGSGYRDPIHMYIYAGYGWNGSNLTNYIYVQHVAPLARDIFPSGGGAGNAVAAVWYDGSTESDSVVAGSTSHYVRLKIYNYNSNYGSDFNVRVIRRM